MEENRIPKTVLYMNLESTRPRGRPKNRWQDEVREDGRIVRGEEWQEKACNREEWKKLLRMARNRRIRHMAMEWMNEWKNEIHCISIMSVKHNSLQSISYIYLSLATMF
jgi:hypothetical protein